MFSTRGNHKATTDAGAGPGARARARAGDCVATVYPRSPHNDWREISINATTQEEADSLAARVEEGGYTGIFLVSPARASARLVDEQGRVFRIGHWPREGQPGRAAAS